MELTIKRHLSVFKLRICTLITFSAVVGFISASVMDVTAGRVFYLTIVTLMASMGASAFNHYFDRDIDAMMKRTEKRPLPSGGVEYPSAVLMSAFGLLLLSIVLSFKLLNYMVGIHLFIGAFVYVVVYTAWLKRRSWTNIIVGGLAGSFAVLAGGASASPEFCAPPVLLAIVMFFWTPSHFWSFAILHKEEYANAGIPMLPGVVGDAKTAVYVLINTVLLVGASLAPVFLGYLGVFYAAAALIVGVYFIAMNIRLVHDASKETARKNFKASMAYLAILLLAVAADTIYF